MTEWKPTGVWDAFLISVLTGSGLDGETVAAMSAQERVDAARMAAQAGRLDAPTIEALKRVGLVENTETAQSEE